MSNTHKIRSRVSADTAPSIIRPAGGFARLPSPRAAWPHRGAGRAGKGPGAGRPLGLHTCPGRERAAGGDRSPSWRPLKGLLACQPIRAPEARLGQAGSPAPQLPGQGGEALAHLRSARASRLEPRPRPAQASELIIAGRCSVFPSISSLAPHHAYQVGPVF